MVWGLMIILLLVAIANLVGLIWLLVKAGQVGVGWVLACLFIPFAILVFAVKYWDEAKKPFLLMIASGVLLAAAGFFSKSSLQKLATRETRIEVRESDRPVRRTRERVNQDPQKSGASETGEQPSQIPEVEAAEVASTAHATTPEPISTPEMQAAPEQTSPDETPTARPRTLADMTPFPLEPVPPVSEPTKAPMGAVAKALKLFASSGNTTDSGESADSSTAIRAEATPASQPLAQKQLNQAIEQARGELAKKGISVRAVPTATVVTPTPIHRESTGIDLSVSPSNSTNNRMEQTSGAKQ